MRFLSLFSGIGGFDLALERHGHECVGYSEINPHAVAVYKSHFPEAINYGNVTQIKAEDLPEYDLLCAGFPCQPFSAAGSRRGFADPRGTMFGHVARIAKCRRPRTLLLENVAGLLHHDHGRTFAVILNTLAGLGYSVEWQVLNSSSFGVPQNRPRVYLVGHLGDGAELSPVFPLHPTTTGSIKNLFVPPFPQFKYKRPCRIYSADGTAPCLTERDTENVIVAGELDRRRIYLQAHSASGISPCLVAEHACRVFIGEHARHLSAVECERLQGFPDGYTSAVSEYQRYRLLGNSVTVPVVEAIVERLGA
jgi:DNA (cytosine-5)-methyltransferase 1